LESAEADELEIEGLEGEADIEVEADEMPYGESPPSEGFELEGELELEMSTGLYEADEAAELEASESSIIGESWEIGEPEDVQEFVGKVGRFFRRVGRGAVRIAKKGVRALSRVAGPLFKKLAPIAARVIGTAIGGPAGAAIAGQVANAVLREGEMEADGEAESVLEAGDESFLEAGGDESAYEMMESYAARAAEAESENDADAAILRMSAHAARMFRANRRVRAAIGPVLQGALALAKMFRAKPETRWAVKLIPTIVKRTLTRLARTRRITRRTIAAAMAQETAWVLANSRRATVTLRRHGRVRRAVHVKPPMRIAQPKRYRTRM
jgi:hypothetical protein